MEEFVNNLNTAKQDLEDKKKSLDEAQAEELEIQKIMESSGDESAKFSQQLTSLLSELEQATEKLNLAQSEVNKTAVQAEVISEQLAKSQETAEENRLALGELGNSQGQALSSNNPSTDRNKLSKDLITAQRSEEKLLNNLN